MEPLSISPSWEDQVYRQLSDVFLFAENSFYNEENVVSKIEILDDIFSHLASYVKNGQIPNLIWRNENVYFHISAVSIGMLEELLDLSNYAFLMNDMAALLIKKQKDYGPLNILEFGQVGLIVRMFDKVARLKNLISKSKSTSDLLSSNSVANESIIDTLMDLIGYSTIGLMLLERDDVYGNKFLMPFRGSNV